MSQLLSSARRLPALALASPLLGSALVTATLLVTGCSGGPQSAPLDPFVGATGNSREAYRYPNGDYGDVNDSAPRPAKQIPRGLREKRYKGGE